MANKRILNLSPYFNYKLNPAAGAVMDEEGNYVSPTGEPVDASVVAKQGTAPVEKPSFWMKLFAPDKAEEAQRINLQYGTKPAFEAQDYGIKKAQTADAIAHGYRYATGKDMPKGELADAVGAFGTKTVQGGLSPGEVAISERARTAIKGGVPATQGETDIVESKRMLESAKASLNRNVVIEATQDAAAANELAKQVNVAPKQIQLMIENLRSELKRNPMQQEVLDRALQVTGLQQSEELQTAPLQGKVARALLTGQMGRMGDTQSALDAEAKLNAGLFNTKLELLPQTQEAMRGASAQDVFNAFHMPASTFASPYLYNVGPEGVSRQTNPITGFNAQMEYMLNQGKNMLGGGANSGGTTYTTQSGKALVIPAPPASQATIPLRPAMSAPAGVPTNAPNAAMPVPANVQTTPVSTPSVAAPAMSWPSTAQVMPAFGGQTMNFRTPEEVRNTNLARWNDLLRRQPTLTNAERQEMIMLGRQLQPGGTNY